MCPICIGAATWIAAASTTFLGGIVLALELLCVLPRIG
jgi:hypothetical protein